MGWRYGRPLRTIPEAPAERPRSRTPQVPAAVAFGAGTDEGPGTSLHRDGALNVYAREPHAFDEDSRTAATRFGPCARSPQVALETQGVIDQAKGILMARHKLTADQAFQVLAQMSMKADRKLHSVADDLVHTGELPLRNWFAPPH